MPNGWNKITLSEFILLQRGFDLPEYSRKNGKVPVVASTGIVGYHDSFQVKGPGVVIGRSGSIGGGQYIEADFWPLNTTLWVKDRKGNDIHYIYYLLKSIDFSIFNAGSGVPTLNRNHLDNIKVFAPPLAEQHAIAHILGTLDDKIELLRRMNKTLEEMARALFKSWFVDFDPVRAKMDGRWTRGGSLPGMPAGMRDLWPSRLVDSELGEIPEGWRVGVVKDVAKSIFSGGTPDTRKAEYWDGNIPWFSSGETRELLITSTEKYISQKGVDESSTRKSVYGDILIASAGQGNTRGQTSFNTIETYINQSVVAIRTDKDKSNPLWLFLNLSNRYEEMRNISDSHSSRGSLTTKLLETMPLILPSKELVDQFFILVNGNINKWIANLIGIKTLMQIRDTLLPKLVSGEVRVPEKRVAEMQKGREGE
ncbi:MAG: restriction endonuclease subunit S [Brevinematales bacterium]|nr:restriction endonuclease subunit S [Brevinematales bacterium]